MYFLDCIDSYNLPFKDDPFFLKNGISDPQQYATWSDVAYCMNTPALYDYSIGVGNYTKNNIPSYHTHWLSEPVIDKQCVFNLFNNGESLVINNYGFHNQSINNILNNIEDKFEVNCAAHVYCGLKASKSFNVHSDTPANFILQIEGRTRWVVYDQRSSNLFDVLKNNVTIKHADFSKSKILIDEVLEPGDVLYLPARQFHVAIPDESRISISIPCWPREAIPRYDRNIYNLNIERKK
jgi:hypothetical protein